jgi:hypothetical protein
MGVIVATVRQVTPAPKFVARLLSPGAASWVRSAGHVMKRGGWQADAL